jgi:hypothetical protein
MSLCCYVYLAALRGVVPLSKESYHPRARCIVSDLILNGKRPDGVHTCTEEGDVCIIKEQIQVKMIWVRALSFLFYFKNRNVIQI